MGHIRSFIALIGRLCLSLIFITSGVGKVLGWEQTIIYMTQAGIPQAQIGLFLAASVEIFMGVALFLGWKKRFAASILALYLIPVTFLFHNFWDLQDPALRMLEYINFMKNLAIFGGLLLVACGPGSYQVDRE